MIPYLLTASEDEEALARGVAGVGSLQVARVYGEALLNAAEEAGQTDAVLADFQSMIEMAETPRSELRRFFASGIIGRITRADVLKNAFDGRAHPLLVNFLLVLNDHDRLTLLPAILFEMNQLRDRRARRLPVFLYTAIEPTNEQVERIREMVRNRLELDPMLQTKVEPELLGGMMLRVGDWVFDGTIRHKVEQIRDQILSRGANEIQSGRDRFSSTNGN